jgi:hypothetical protein
MKDIQTDNFDQDVRQNPELVNWVVGYARPEDSPLRTNSVYVKWVRLKKGQEKAAPSFEPTANTLGVLISGKIAQNFPTEDKTIILQKQGDYIYFGPNVPHTWSAIEDCLILTVRWPASHD